jgi:hypothetical protein
MHHNVLTSPLIPNSHASYGVYGTGTTKLFAGEVDMATRSDLVKVASGLQHLAAEVHNYHASKPAPAMANQFYFNRSAGSEGACEVSSRRSPAAPGAKLYSNKSQCMSDNHMGGSDARSTPYIKGNEGNCTPMSSNQSIPAGAHIFHSEASCKAAP